MKNAKARLRRKKRIRTTITGTAERPRLTVFRSAKHMYAQIVDDLTGTTLASASTLMKSAAGETSDKTSAAKRIGQVVAAACKQKGIDRVVFDRNGFIYHGRVKALADGAREGGLSF